MAGGARAGAGRKKKAGEILQVLSIRVTSHEKALIKDYLSSIRASANACASIPADNWCKITKDRAQKQYAYYLDKLIYLKSLITPTNDDEQTFTHYLDLASIYAEMLGKSMQDIKNELEEHPDVIAAAEKRSSWMEINRSFTSSKNKK